MSFFSELRRRNVIRVAAAYAVIAWLLAQVADVGLDAFDAPAWVLKTVFLLLALGFPLALFFAWAFEMTPEGVKREKDVDRSASITDQTGQRLNRFIIGTLVVAVGFLLVDKFVLQDTAAPADQAEPAAVNIERSVAVLPFVAMSNGPDDEYFADGLTEEILNSLAQVPDLLVTARTSAFAFKGMDVAIPEVAEKLGVANVVEGSVRRAGERLRVTAQLIRATDGFHLWSETFERSAEDSFGVQDEIAEKIATALNVVLDEQQLARMRASGLRNPEAFITFQKGLQMFADAHAAQAESQAEALALANLELDKVLALQPNFSRAHYAHADYYIHLVIDQEWLAGSSEDEIANAIENARTDLKNAARTATSEGDRLNATLEYATISKEWRRLGELMTSAVESGECITPSWWSAWGPLLQTPAEETALWQGALACDPLNFYNWANLANTAINRGDFPAALEVASEGVQIVPHRQIADQLVLTHIGLGQFEAAMAANERYVESSYGRQRNRFRIAAASGNAEEARTILAEIGATSGMDDLAVANYAMLGDREQANLLAAQLDEQPFGFLELLDAADSCKCGAPFDLEATPNFVQAIDEARLNWPPRAPIAWPLKDW